MDIERGLTCCIHFSLVLLVVMSCSVQICIRMCFSNHMVTKLLFLDLKMY